MPASLEIRTSVWLQMTPQQRDDTYLAHGFDPMLPVLDCGTTQETVKFCQADPVTGPDAVPVLPFGTQAGDDLRDIPQATLVGLTEDLIGDNPVTDEFGQPIAGAALAIAGRALRLILGGGGGRLTAATWAALPSIVRTALTQVGIGVGALIAFNGDIPFITLPGQGDSSIAPQNGFIGPLERPVDIQIGGAHAMHGATVVGSWNTNPKNPADGVTFYRLSNGWLAVQNKKGRWKTWKPKKPIVLYANGAKDIKTLLRADKAVTGQAKKIAAMLNRRAPRSKRAPSNTPKPIVVDGTGRIINVSA